MTRFASAKLALLTLFSGISLCTYSEEAAVRPSGNCPLGTDFEIAGYTIRTVRIENPFEFLRWVRARIDDAKRDVSSLAGRPYRTVDVQRTARELEGANFLPEAGDQRVRVSLVVTSVENCSGGKLDLVYSVLSSQIAPVLSGTFESWKAERTVPERVAGADQVTGRLRISPAGGYERSERLFGGGRMEYRLSGAGSGPAPLDSLELEGLGSTSMHELSAALAGSRDTAAGLIAHADWQLNYLNSSQPSDQSQLRKNRLSAQLSAITRPLGRWRLPMRLGGLLEGGRLESDFREAALSRDTVPKSDYGAAKLFLGTTTRLDRSVLAASYGIELGSTTAGARMDWIKHVADLAHDIVLPVGDHRSLEIESRLTAGLLDVRGSVPVTARFFGGNREEPFIAGETWTIRSNPVIRSIPANRFNLTAAGPGATRFVAYNMTAAIPLWRRPIVPPELSQDIEFEKQLETQITTATSFVQTDYAARDPHFKLAAGRIGDVRAALAKLNAAVGAAASARPGQFTELFTACAKTIERADRRAQAAARSKEGEQLGNVAALLAVDEDRLNGVDSACVGDLNARIGDPAVAAHGASLRQIHAEMEREFSLIDQSSASRQAEAEMAYVKRTLHALVYDLNVFSIGPVVGFDFAHIGPADSRLGTRYGIGGGLRVTLVNSTDLTLGYFANPKRLSKEPSGAFFLSVRFKDLLE